MEACRSPEPSMQALDPLKFSSTDCHQWRAALDSYEGAVQLLTSQKKGGRSRAKAGAESLSDLDSWYQKDLPVAIVSRDTPHLTHPELCKLMKWKLTRGKFRPRLTELVQQNTPTEVQSVTRAAIAALPDLEGAVSRACRLKAVGPATASALLCAASSQVPFMADEAALAVPGLGKLAYTLKQYIVYATALQQKAKELNTNGDNAWTAHKVELALWSSHYMHKLQPSEKCVLGKRRKTDRDELEINGGGGGEGGGEGGGGGGGTRKKHKPNPDTP